MKRKKKNRENESSLRVFTIINIPKKKKKKKKEEYWIQQYSNLY